MKGKQAGQLECIVLVSTPWPLYSRPSIQLGALKAYLKTEFDDLEIKALHFYLKVAESIGYKLYHAISERSWLAESVYGALLFPERTKEIEKIFYHEASGKADLRKVDFKTLTSQVKEVSEGLVNSVDWGCFGLAGFSICLCQLTSSLYFIKSIKQSFPNLPIVVGGSGFAGETTRGLLERFPEVNFVVNGEGELPLSQLVRNMRNSGGRGDMRHIPKVIMGKGAKTEIPVSFHQVQDLSTLPPPDYDDYFHLLKTFHPEKTFFPTLPAEISRGCWWRCPNGSARRRGCAFCNLNRQWNGYRSKGASQVVSEIDHLATRYKTLSVAFMDNLLPVRQSREIFLCLGKLHKDFRLFGEIRASTPRGVLKAMRAAGMHEIQIGIEALSTSLLNKLNKGTTAIQNLEIMKHCEELNISNISNLILHFPGSDAEDVDETLRALEFALPFRPLRPVRFWLGLGSPVWQNPRAFGLNAVFNHPNYAALFPPDICRSTRFMIQSYRGDLKYQKKMWQPVKKKVKAWKEAYAELHRGPSYSPILSFRDGQDFLIVCQKRFRAEPLTHRLVGTSRAIYLFCQRRRSLKSVLVHFTRVGEDRIVPFLRMMVDKKLMFEENGKFLSLAVPARPTNI
ncbi:MAG: RiPP maturation radical SAM protein 1 [Desulfobacterales bacterium]|nr:RiPP maturation radical SAM protein 1 [Desulfobacterales bacterium]